MTSGTEWEEEFIELVRIRYQDKAPGHFQKVPAEYLGDYGVEGFDRDGVAYQCYGPLVPLMPSDEYEAFRDKMTQDLNKLVKNKDGLVEILGQVKIQRWVFGVPQFTNKELLAHANIKAAEILALQLPHVAANFHIAVVTREDFAPELAYLDSLGSELISSNLTTLAEDDVARWVGQHDALASTLSSKVAKIGMPAENRPDFKLMLVRAFLRADSLKATLRAKRFELFSRIQSANASHEAELEYAQFVSHPSNMSAFQSTVAKQQQLLQGAAPSVDPSSRAHLAHGAVADWLMRCPLDFQEAD